MNSIPLTAKMRNKTAFWPAISIVVLIIFAAILSPTLTSSMNIYFIFLSAIFWISSKKGFNQPLFRVIVPFGFIIVVAAISGLGADTYLYAKDIWYISNPAIVITVGFVFYKIMPNISLGMRSFVIGGTLLAVIHITKFIYNPSVLMLDASEIRLIMGTGYYAPPLALIIIFSYKDELQSKLKMSTFSASICSLLCMVAIAVSFSRTIFVLVLIGIFSSYGFFARREIIRIGGIVLVAVTLIFSLQLVVGATAQTSTSSLIGKLARVFDELTITEFNDLKSINLNWRGYETARALKFYASGNPLQWLAGHGLGAQLDLGLSMPLGTDEAGDKQSLRFVPILHNGYAYLLMKGGALAILFFVYSLGYIYYSGRRGASSINNVSMKISSRLLQTSAITLAFTTWVVAGVFNKLDLFPFLLISGFLIGAIQDNEKEHQ